jgi:hypothetical protein
MIYKEVSDVFANFGLKQVLNLEPSSLDLSGMVRVTTAQSYC